MQYISVVLCMTLFCSAQYSNELSLMLNDNFTSLLPLEVICMIFNHLQARTFDEYKVITSLWCVSRAVQQAVQLTSEDRWKNLIRQLFDSKDYGTLQKIKRAQIPQYCKIIFHALFLHALIHDIRLKKEIHARKYLFINDIPNNISVSLILKDQQDLVGQENINFIENLFYYPEQQRIIDKEGSLICQLKSNRPSIFGLLFNFVIGFKKHNNTFIDDKIVIATQLLSYALSTDNKKVFKAVYAVVCKMFSQKQVSFCYKINYLTDLLQQSLIHHNQPLFNFLIEELRNMYWHHVPSQLICL